MTPNILCVSLQHSHVWLKKISTGGKSPRVSWSQSHRKLVARNEALFLYKSKANYQRSTCRWARGILGDCHNRKLLSCGWVPESTTWSGWVSESMTWSWWVHKCMTESTWVSNMACRSARDNNIKWMSTPKHVCILCTVHCIFYLPPNMCAFFVLFTTLLLASGLTSVFCVETDICSANFLKSFDIVLCEHSQLFFLPTSASDQCALYRN